MIRGKDIAKRIGVSKQTVSAVLSGRWKELRICHRTRDRVLATAHQMGYVPHHAARRLARTRSDSRATSFDQIGLIHLTRPDTKNSFVDPVCLAMMQGAEYAFSKLHASLTFIRITESEDWQKIERLTRSGGVDGWMVYGCPDDDAVVHRLQPTKLPSVILGDRRCTQPVHSVNVDNEAVGRLA